MDGEAQRVPIDEMPVARAGHDVERAVDGDGHHRQLEFVSQGKGTLTEMSHVAGKGACALGKHGEAGAALQGLTSLVTPETVAKRRGKSVEEIVG